jgi:hypothetical protein
LHESGERSTFRAAPSALHSPGVSPPDTAGAGRDTCGVGFDHAQANAAKLFGDFMIAAMLEAFGAAFATLRGPPPCRADLKDNSEPNV